MECAPYILRITNVSAFTRSNVPFFDAQTDYGTIKAFTGSLAAGVTATVPFVGNLVTYNTLLYELLSSAIVIKRLQIVTTDPNNLRNLRFLVQNYDTRGSGGQYIANIKIDPYQNLNDSVIYDDKPFILDGNTIMTLSQIRPTSAMELWFFPAKKVQIRDAKDLSHNEIIYGKIEDYKKQAFEMSNAYNWAL